jgi:hypothetical protein
MQLVIVFGLAIGFFVLVQARGVRFGLMILILMYVFVPRQVALINVANLPLLSLTRICLFILLVYCSILIVRDNKISRELSRFPLRRSFVFLLLTVAVIVVGHQFRGISTMLQTFEDLIIPFLVWGLFNRVGYTHKM